MICKSLFICAGRSNRSETSMRFHQPRSAPSSPTLDRRPMGFDSPPKSPNGLSATTSYRKELRLRNSNFADTRYINYYVCSIFVHLYKSIIK